jgi:hypothetical protein
LGWPSSPAKRAAVTAHDHAFNELETTSKSAARGDDASIAANDFGGRPDHQVRRPPYTLQLVGGELTGHLFLLPVLIEVQEPGRHTIAVTLDGEQITRLPLDAFLGAGPPDDDPRRLTEG